MGMDKFTPEQITAAIARAAEYIENASGNVCLDEDEAEHIIAALPESKP